MANTKVPVELSSTPSIVDNGNATAITIDSSENVGIGCTPTSFATEIQATSGGNALKLRGRSAAENAGWLVWTDNADNVEAAMYATANNLIFANTTSYTERMRIDSSGNVGIGTTSPDGKLDIASAQNTTNQFTSPHLALTATSTTNTTGFTGISYASSSVTNYGWTVGVLRDTTGNNSDFVFNIHNNSASGSERMRIDGATGNVGIGTSSPNASADLHIADTSDTRIWVEATSGDTAELYAGTGVSLFNRSNSFLNFGTNNTERMRIDSSGNVGIGAAPVAAEGVFLQTGNNTISQRGFSTNIYYDGSNYRAINTGGSTLIQGGDNHIFYTAASASAGATQTPVERMRIDSSGRLLVGLTGASGFGTLETTSFASDGSCYLARSSGNVLVGTTNNSMSLKVCVNGSFGSVTSGNGNRNFIVNTVSNENWNAAGTVVYCGKNGTTSRSINAGGTINASGADYAEYMKKADTCGTIAKGDVCGVDSTGKLTDVFADSLSFVIKSTNPSYVGGDTWGDVDLGLTEEQTETERQKYDRIAFSGQVPVNITGSFNVGDYVYPQANGTDIECVAKSSPTFEEYQICVGKIWATEDDGRPLVAVKIG